MASDCGGPAGLWRQPLARSVTDLRNPPMYPPFKAILTCARQACQLEPPQRLKPRPRSGLGHPHARPGATVGVGTFSESMRARRLDIGSLLEDSGKSWNLVAHGA